MGLLHRCSLNLALAPAAAAVLLLTSPLKAQVIQTTVDPTAPPFNAERVFDPTPLPVLNRDNPEPVAPEDTPVRTRQQPGYEQVGIRDGSWIFLPSFMAGAFYDNNVFASNLLKRSDIAEVFEPSLRAHTLWEQHGIDLTLTAQQSVYDANPGLDQTNASLKGNAWYDISSDFAILTNFEISHLNVGVGSLASPAGAVQPTPYDFFSGDVSLRKEFNRLTTAIGFRAESYSFGSTKAEDGSVISLESLDGQIYTLHGRVDYAISPTLGWFAGAEGDERDLRGTPGASLNSQGFRTLSGVTLAFTNLISGEFGAGWVQQKFVDQVIGTIEGPSYRAILNWSPTRLLDVHFKAEQIVTETAQTSSTGVLADAFQVGADYELRRDIVLSATGAEEIDHFFGVVRKDHVFSTDERIKYMLNRYGSIAVYHQYTNRDSSDPIFSYDKHQVGINVTAQF